MNDQEKDRLIVEALGECWHDIKYLVYSVDEPWYECQKCRKAGRIKDFRLNLATWEGFGWWWERAQKMEWWDEFLAEHGNYIKGYRLDCFDVEVIHPTRGRDALSQWLQENPEKWNVKN